jgi:hypothetical protein
VKYIWLEGAWVPLDAFPPRVASSGPAIHPDFAEPLLCHADGRMHGSKSTYDAAVRAAGCEIIGKTEARRMAEAPRERASGLEPVGATLKRLLNGG